KDDALKVANAALRFRPADAADEPAGAAAAERAPGARAGTGGTDGGAPDIDIAVARMTRTLALTDEQQRQVRDIMSRTRDRIAALRDRDLPPEELRAEMRREREQRREAIAALLTAGQRERYLEARDARQSRQTRRGQVWVIGADGKPAPVEVVTGISDGAMTEI